MMSKKVHLRPEVYAEAHTEMLKHCSGALPAVLDPFAGGGSIPLEASRMGFEVHARDLNPVAVVLNKCNLELAPRWSGRPPVNKDYHKRIGGGELSRGTHGLAADVRYYGELIRERAFAKIGHLYPKVSLPRRYGGGDATVIAWIWARTVSSPNPAAHGKHIPLSSSFMLSTKSDNAAWIELIRDDSASGGWLPRVRSGNISPERLSEARLGARSGKAQSFICSLTSTPVPRSYVQAEGKAGRMSTRLVAIIAAGFGGKLFLSPLPDHETLGKAAAANVEEARTTFLAGVLSIVA
jgi:putative DNA methylase